MTVNLHSCRLTDAKRLLPTLFRQRPLFFIIFIIMNQIGSSSFSNMQPSQTSTNCMIFSSSSPSVRFLRSLISKLMFIAFSLNNHCSRKIHPLPNSNPYLLYFERMKNQIYNRKNIKKIILRAEVLPNPSYSVRRAFRGAWSMGGPGRTKGSGWRAARTGG